MWRQESVLGPCLLPFFPSLPEFILTCERSHQPNCYSVACVSLKQVPRGKWQILIFSTVKCSKWYVVPRSPGDCSDTLLKSIPVWKDARGSLSPFIFMINSTAKNQHQDLYLKLTSVTGQILSQPSWRLQVHDFRLESSIDVFKGLKKWSHGNPSMTIQNWSLRRGH